MDMAMSESMWWMVGLMAFLIVVVGGVLVTFRVYAGHQVEGDHPHGGRRARRKAAGSDQRPRDAVEDV